jgi:uncharacterized protein YndB with AHSA1/START domain
MRRSIAGTAACFLILAVADLTGQTRMQPEQALQATKPSDFETVLTRTFDAPREAVFGSLTQSKHVVQWMKPTNMALATCEIDLRPGGSFRYVFQRPGGRKLEVRGAYNSVEPPIRFAYVETYDFSPLQLTVVTTLDQSGGGTVFRQTITYASKRERDEDFDGVVTSATEVYANLERYLKSWR